MSDGDKIGYYDRSYMAGWAKISSILDWLVREFSLRGRLCVFQVEGTVEKNVTMRWEPVWSVVETSLGKK